MKDTNAVSKAIMVFQDKILLLKPSDKAKWHLPGGHLVKGENFQQGMMREVYEETGIHINHYLCISTNNNFRLFLCKSNKSSVKLSSEHEKYVWIKPQEALKTIPMTKETYRDISLVVMCIKKFGSFFSQKAIKGDIKELQQDDQDVNS